MKLTELQRQDIRKRSESIGIPPIGIDARYFEGKFGLDWLLDETRDFSPADIQSIERQLAEAEQRHAERESRRLPENGPLDPLRHDPLYDLNRAQAAEAAREAQRRETDNGRLQTACELLVEIRDLFEQGASVSSPDSPYYVTRGLFREWGALTGWPALPPHVAAGEAEWDRAIARSMPPWRASMVPSWFSHELIATSAARAKLAAWLSTHAHDEPAPDPADVLVSLSINGDHVLSHLCARTICKLPPPVAEYVRRQVTFASVGLQTLGWCGPRPSDGGRPWFIVLSSTLDESAADRFRDLTAHECAHAWLMDEPDPDVRAANAFYMQTVYDSPIDRVPESKAAAVGQARDTYDLYERQCRELTRRWGFGDPA